MPQTVSTPHRVARPGGDVFVSHAGFLEYLYDCAQAWEQRGERAQADLIRKQILKVKRIGERRCKVCRHATEKFSL